MWIADQIGHVDLSALLDDVGVLLAHQPSNVSEEKAATRVVRISVGVSELVVHTMIASPLQDGLLTSHGLEEDDDQLKRCVGFECLVGKEAMRANGGSKSREDSDDPSNCRRSSVFWQRHTVNGKNVKNQEDYNVSPLNLHLVVGRV